MGFGILFFGYFTAFAFALIPTYFYADIIGSLVMLRALSVLSSHKPKFKVCTYVDMAFAVISATRAVGRTFGLWSDGGALGVALTALWAAAALVFHFFLTGAIHSLAIDAEDKKIVSRSSFNRSFSATAYIFFIAHILLKDVLPGGVVGVTEKLSLFLLIACVLFMAFLIYSSFVSFIPVSGEVEEPTPSKIPLVNKIRRSAYERRKRELEQNKELYADYLNRKAEVPAYAKKKKKKK